NGKETVNDTFSPLIRPLLTGRSPNSLEITPVKPPSASVTRMVPVRVPCSLTISVSQLPATALAPAAGAPPGAPRPPGPPAPAPRAAAGEDDPPRSSAPSTNV